MPDEALGCLRVQVLDLCAPPLGLMRLVLSLNPSFALMSDQSAQGRYSYFGLGQTICVLNHMDHQDVQEQLKSYVPPLVHNAQDIDLPPFTGGLIGMASFELGARLESLDHKAFVLRDDAPWPELVLLKVDRLFAWDHHTNQLIAIGRGHDLKTADTALMALLGLHETALKSDAKEHHHGTKGLASGLMAEVSATEFEQSLQILIQSIHDGQLFQANLARGHRGFLKEQVDPLDVLMAFIETAPAPFGAFLRIGQRAIVSNSPERFIQLKQNGSIETRPIKGTRPRGQTPQSDAGFAQALLLSEKDRAENLMIVDLMRNDLSKISEVGSVKVTQLCALESFKNVHHLVSIITAQLKPGLDAADLLLATLSAGSISGAPKVAALKAIAKLEPPRGPYCGSLFYVDIHGAMDSNVLIRTIAFEQDDQGWALRVCGGGGIVADSDPLDEIAEGDAKLSLIRTVLLGEP